MKRGRKRRLPKRSYAQYKLTDAARWQTVNRAQMRYLRGCADTDTDPDRDVFLFLAQPEAVA